jgi:hypothetical protein
MKRNRSRSRSLTDERFVPLQVKRRGVELRLVIPSAHTERPKVDLAFSLPVEHFDLSFKPY